MTDTDLRLVACQLGDCGNAAALTVTVELPTSWTESREYTTRTLLVAVCGECAPVLEAQAKALLEARTRFARRLEVAEDADRLLARVKAQTLERAPSDAPAASRRRGQRAEQPLSIDDARFRRRAVVRRPETPPRGGDDAA